MLHLFRRHYPPCPHTSRRYRRCTGPIWGQGSLGGEWIKKSLNVTSWEAGRDLVTGWTASGQIGVFRPDIPPLKEAVEKFIAVVRVEGLSPPEADYPVGACGLSEDLAGRRALCDEQPRASAIVLSLLRADEMDK